jgi:inward rectifier potassium channel
MNLDSNADPTVPPVPRLIRRDGDLAPILFGHPRSPFSDLYHQVLAMPLAGVLALMGATFIIINLVFAELYLWAGGVANLRPGDLWNAFFFSVETFGTIGYGYIYPQGLWANLLMTAETFVGLVYVALATGLVFARVSRPTARVTFSQQAVITEFDGVPTLMFRAANRRANLILEAEVLVSLARDATTAEGQSIRRFDELRIRRARTPLFALTWTVMHPIDEASPLWGATSEVLQAQRVELIIALSGVDDRYAQRVHARHSYDAGEIVWNKRLADILSVGPGGRRVIDFRRFHDLVDV